MDEKQDTVQDPTQDLTQDPQHSAQTDAESEAQSNTQSNAQSSVRQEAEGQASQEVDILREELASASAKIAGLEKQLEDAKAASLRAKAEVQTVRRRAAQEEMRARDKGADSVVLSVLPAYDDLRRALEAAGDDPAKIIPGVEQVRESIKRNLEALGISEVGQVGEAFDPNFHEALTAMPTDDEGKKGTIAQVFESGFVKDERMVRVARVVVFDS